MLSFFLSRMYISKYLKHISFKKANLYFTLHINMMLALKLFRQNSQPSMIHWCNKIAHSDFNL